MELTLGSLVNGWLVRWRRVPPATQRGSRLTMEPAWRRRKKIGGPEAGGPPIDGWACELTGWAKPALLSPHGCQRPVRTLPNHDAGRRSAVRYAVALVEPPRVGVGIAWTLVLAIGVRIVKRAIAGFGHRLLCQGTCHAGCRHHGQSGRRAHKPVSRHRIPPCEGPEGDNPVRPVRIPCRTSHTSVTTATPSPGSTPGAIMAGLAADLLDEMDAFDANAALDRLDHVVDRKTGDRHRRQRFHLDACRTGDLDGGADDAAGQFFVWRDVEGDLGQRQRVAQRDEFRGALGRHDAGDAGGAQHVALFGVSGDDQIER